jgi:hypothetical protein
MYNKSPRSQSVLIMLCLFINVNKSHIGTKYVYIKQLCIWAGWYLTLVIESLPDHSTYRLTDWLIYWLIYHFYSAHIHSIKCLWRLANVLASSQKVSHPEMRLVSAAIGTLFHFPFWELWCMLVFVCFHNLVTYAQRLQDLYSACLMFWISECIHTLDLGFSSYPKDVRVH